MTLQGTFRNTLVECWAIAFFFCIKYFDQLSQVQNFLNSLPISLKLKFFTPLPIGYRGIWGGCAENASFKVNSHDLVHSFCLRCPRNVRHPISTNKIEGAHPACTKSANALLDVLCQFLYLTTSLVWCAIMAQFNNSLNAFQNWRSLESGSCPCTHFGTQRLLTASWFSRKFQLKRAKNSSQSAFHKTLGSKKFF